MIDFDDSEPFGSPKIKFGTNICYPLQDEIPSTKAKNENNMNTFPSSSMKAPNSYGVL